MGADINACCRDHGNALEVAVYQGNKNIVLLLLDRGTGIDQHREKYSSASYSDLPASNEEILETLDVILRPLR